MKKFFFILFLFFGILNEGYAQIRVSANGSTSNLSGSSAFLDASSSAYWNGLTNDSKGLLFPHTDLTTFSTLIPSNSSANNNPNRFDGMVVFNTATGTAAIGGTAVIPGFYFYRNSSTTSNNGGTWISMVPTIDNTVNTIALTADATITQSNSTVYCSGAFTLTLPVANTVAGKIFRIVKNDTDNSILTFSENIYSTASTNFNTLNYSKTLLIQSNGTTWTIIN